MKCPNCNNEVAEGVNFCNACGKPVNSGSTPQAGPAPTMNTQQNVNPQYTQQNVNPQYAQQNMTSQYNQMPNQGTAVAPQGGMAKQCKMISIIGFAVALVSLFLPFGSIVSIFGTVSTSLIEGGDGFILLPFIIVGIVLAVVNKVKFTIIPSAIMVIFIIFYMIYYSSVGEGMIQYGIGFYLLLLSAVATIVAFVLSLKNK